VSAVAIREPANIVEVQQQCESVERWAATVDDIGDLRDAQAKLDAIGVYLARMAIDGRARVAESFIRLDQRIAELLGPAVTGRPSENVSGGDLSRNDRHRIRQLGDHPEIVDEVIAESTDLDPATRNKILQRIKDHEETKALMANNPPDFDPVLNKKQLEAMGALKRCCTEIAASAPPEEWLDSIGGICQLTNAHVKAAADAVDWLMDFLLVLAGPKP
jgi:hypothetical protein